MHFEAIQFLKKVSQLFPDYFVSKRVIDIGAGDVNGNNKHLFNNCLYFGVDVVSAPNVDIVCKAKDIPEELGLFDVVISSECFEHDQQVYQTFQRILKLVAPGGLFLFTCASTGRMEHGTKRTTQTDSYSQKLVFDHRTDWYPNYYQNITMEHVAKFLDLQTYFDEIHMEFGKATKDLYFYGIRNQNQNFDKINALSAVFDKYQTDKNSSFHNYPRQYDALIDRFRFKNIRVLEIGVFSGQSLQAWRQALPNAYSIVGIDIEPSAQIFQSPDNGIWIEIGDQSNVDFLKTLVAKHGPFDLIIDDGSHINSHVIKSFEVLFPLLTENGLYIVEDTICYKSASHLKSEQPNHLEYFWQLTKHLNQWGYDQGQTGRRDNCVDPFKLEKKTDDRLEQTIDRIEFGCSYVAVTKLTRKHWISEQSMIEESLLPGPSSSNSI